MNTDIAFFIASCAGAFGYITNRPLPYKSYGGRMHRSTYLAPAAAWLGFRLLTTLLPPESLFAAASISSSTSPIWPSTWARVCHAATTFVGGSLALFLALALDPEQSGPGLCVAFVANSATCAVIVGGQAVSSTPAGAVYVSEVGVPIAVAFWWVASRAMASD